MIQKILNNLKKINIFQTINKQLDFFKKTLKSQKIPDFIIGLKEPQLTIQQYFIIFLFSCLILKHYGPSFETIHNFLKNYQNCEYNVIKSSLEYYSKLFCLHYNNKVTIFFIPQLVIGLTMCFYGISITTFAMSEHCTDEEQFEMEFIYCKNHLLCFVFLLLMNYTGVYSVIISLNFINIIVQIIIPLSISIFIVIRYTFYNKQMLISYDQLFFLMVLISGSLEIYNYWDIL